MNNEYNPFLETEDDKYGGLEVNNFAEELDWMRGEVIQIKSKQDKDLNQRNDVDYHNTYRINGEYKTRTLRMSNKEWHQLDSTKDILRNIIE